MSSRQGLEMELARLTERFEEQPAGRVFAPLADCHRKLGQLDTALQICLTGLTRHPRYSSAQLILGKIFLDRGEDGPAREALQTVLELDGQNLLAMRLLAEMAERMGQLDEAEVRWRQLAACEYDPELTEERLEAIAQQRQAAAMPGSEPTRESGPVPDLEDSHQDVAADDTAKISVVRAEPELSDQVDAPDVPDASDASDADQNDDIDADPVDDTSSLVDPAFEVVPAAEPAPAPVFPDMGVGGGRTSEIATLTLAGIYAEQGFKAKALEIYLAIESRNPDLPGLRAKIEQIESAMARVDKSVVAELEFEDPAGQDRLEVVASAATVRDDQESGAPLPSEPLFSDVPSSAGDPAANDASRYRRFGSWLDRVKSDDED